ncbi:MAG: nodulation protein NfeD [Salibacteraceae bacterium]
MKSPRSFLILRLLSLLWASFWLVPVGFAQTDTTTSPSGEEKLLVYTFDIKEEIASPVWRTTQRAMAEADSIEADLVLVQMNTYGGRVDMADSIRTRLLHAKMPVYVFIENNAASAGALISIACDSIYMRSGSTIGAATVVNQNAEAAPDKYQSYFRNKMRATAEANGRDPDIAEAMVDPDKYVPGVSDSGKVVTFSVAEAIENGFCEAMVGSAAEALEHAGITNYEIRKYKASNMDSVIKFLLNDALRGILVLIMIGGIYFELQTPGVGFPIVGAMVAAVLYFAPAYLEGLAANWEIVLFFVGLVLLAVEVFAIPGFGVAGFSGIMLIITSLVLTMWDNDGLDFSFVDGEAIARSLLIIVLSSALALGGSVWLGGRLLQTHMLSRMVLDTVQARSEGYVGTDANHHHLVGARGTAATVLRPSGKVEINGDLYDATAGIGFIEKDTVIEVAKYEAAQLFVYPVEDA